MTWSNMIIIMTIILIIITTIIMVIITVIIMIYLPHPFLHWLFVETIKMNINVKKYNILL